jgi:hypothetical protein
MGLEKWATSQNRDFHESTYGLEQRLPQGVTAEVALTDQQYRFCLY